MEEASSDSDDSSDSDTGMPAPDALNNAKIMARHIAAHCQVLMLLTIRFAALLSVSDISSDDGDADSVNIDRHDTTNSVGEIPGSRGLPSTAPSDDSHLDSDDIVQDCDSLPDATVNLRGPLGLPGGSHEAGGVDEPYARDRDLVHEAVDQAYTTDLGNKIREVLVILLESIRMKGRHLYHSRAL
jgi:hypothetical protein